jgi:hypothetical protein
VARKRLINLVLNGFQGARQGDRREWMKELPCQAYGHCEQTQRSPNTKVISPEKYRDVVETKTGAKTKNRRC